MKIAIKVETSQFDVREPISSVFNIFMLLNNLSHLKLQFVQTCRFTPPPTTTCSLKTARSTLAVTVFTEVQQITDLIN